MLLLLHYIYTTTHNNTTLNHFSLKYICEKHHQGKDEHLSKNDVGINGWGGSDSIRENCNLVLEKCALHTQEWMQRENYREKFIKKNKFEFNTMKRKKPIQRWQTYLVCKYDQCSQAKRIRNAECKRMCYLRWRWAVKVDKLHCVALKTKKHRAPPIDTKVKKSNCVFFLLMLVFFL